MGTIVRKRSTKLPGHTMYSKRKKEGGKEKNKVHAEDLINYTSIDYCLPSSCTK